MWPSLSVIQHSAAAAPAMATASSTETKRSPWLCTTSKGRPIRLAAAASGLTLARRCPVRHQPSTSAPGTKNDGNPDNWRNCRSIMAPKWAKALSATTASITVSSAAASNAEAAPIDAPSTPTRRWPCRRSQSTAPSTSSFSAAP
jgi:hypothetical protein